MVFKQLPSEYLQAVIFFSNHFSTSLVSDSEMEECYLLQIMQKKGSSLQPFSTKILQFGQGRKSL